MTISPNFSQVTNAQLQQLSKDIAWKADTSITLNNETITQISSEERSILPSVQALHVAIVEKFESLDAIVTFFINFKKPTFFNDMTSTSHSLCALHVAAISQDLATMEKILKAGGNPNVQDRKAWRPLHFAALHGNQRMIELLQSYSAKDSKTDFGAGYKDILKLAHPAPSSNPHIPVFWEDSQGKVEQLTHAKFKELTKATYLEECRISPEKLYAQWANLTPKRERKKWPAEFNVHIRKDPPTHLLKEVSEDEEGGKLASSSGIGLFAMDSYNPGDFLGEYRGVVDQRLTANAYTAETVDGGLYRNEMAQINDAFVNATLVPVQGVRGLETRYLFFAIDVIKPKQQICWNYGIHQTKYLTYSELRPKAVREFIKNTKDLDKIIKDIRNFCLENELSFKDFADSEKLKYIMQSPAVLFLMVLDGTIDSIKAAKLHQYAYLLNCYADMTKNDLNPLIQMAAVTVQIMKECTNYPNFKAAFKKDIKDYVLNKGIMNSLIFIQRSNTCMGDILNQVNEASQSDKDWTAKAADEVLLFKWNDFVTRFKAARQ